MKHSIRINLTISIFLLCLVFTSCSSKTEDWKDEDASYIGSEDFKEDIDDISDDVYEKANDSKKYTNKEEEIWKYCMDRWEYYDELEGGYSGDKYTEEVFDDAGEKFGISDSEAERIWDKVDKAKLGIN